MKLSALTASLLLSSIPASAADRPSFIIILADDLGYNDLGCFGSPDIATPELDRMAREGMRMTSFHMAAPTCTASRAALMTGCYPVRVGMGDEIAPRADGTVSPSRVLWPNSPLGLNLAEVTVAEVLRDAGYKTGIVGKWHLGDAPAFNPIHQGFDEFFGVLYSNDMEPFTHFRGTQPLPEPVNRDRQVQRYTEEAVDFIRRSKDKPFFLYLAHTMPHIPLAASERFKGKSPRGPYGDAVSEVDWSVGQLLAALRELKLDSRTLVLFSSDNGGWLVRGEQGGLNVPLRGGKGGSYEGGFCVPCVVWQPGTIPAEATCNEFASSMDLLPTFAKLAGGKAPADRKIDGHDIGLLLRGDAGATSPWEHFEYYFGNELHAVRSGRWKLRAKNTLANENIYNAEWRESDVVVPAALYDLSRDPAEQKSVLKDHPRVAKRLRGYLQSARADLGDSLTGQPPSNARPVGRVAPGEIADPKPQ
jgi:arylsulfatase A